MKLHKVDTTAWTVREVEGTPWPGSDTEGDSCYDNTHFVSERAAWDKLKAEVQAGACLAGRRVTEAKLELASAEREAGEMAEALMKVCDQLLALWPQMIAALAAIDEALGLPQDGCNSTAQTLAKIRNLRAAEDKCNSYIVDNARLAEEVQRLRLLTFCGCGDQFTAHDPGACGACVAGMTCAPGGDPGA